MAKVFQHSSHGFSLVELAVVITIIGILTTGILSYYSSIQMRTQSRAVKTQFETLKEALDGYIDQAGMLPCPAAFNAAIHESAFGSPTDCAEEKVLPGPCEDGKPYCVQLGRLAGGAGDPAAPVKPLRVRIGAVPARALNIPFEAMRDPWGNYITYAVTEVLARSPSDYSQADGGIEILDSGGHSAVTPPQTAAYVLISHGADKAGGRSFGRGARGEACAEAETADGENCDFSKPQAAFRSSFYTPAAGKAHFDDTIIYRTKSRRLVGGVVACADLPLCTAQNEASVPVCQVPGGSNGMPLCAQRTDLRGGTDESKPYEHDMATWKEACRWGNGWGLPTLEELRVLYSNRDAIGGFENGRHYLSQTSYNPVTVGNDDRKLEIWTKQFGDSGGKEKTVNIFPGLKGRGGETGAIRCVRR